MKLEKISQESVHCVPVPKWVDHQPFRSEIPDTETSCIANGICRLLRDSQVNLASPEFAWHFRSVQRVLTREGAQGAAHVVLEFDPGFQRIEVHSVRLVRDGINIEHARPEAFQVFRRETNLERLIFDGRLTASLLIPDVRIGDLVELCVTYYGHVPVLADRYTAWATFDSFSPWFDSRYRLVRPHTLPVFIKEFNKPPERTVTTNAETEDSRWQLIGQERRIPEALAPPWLMLSPTLQLSGFASWGELAGLLAPHYEGDALPESLAQEVDRLASANDKPELRAVEWLRFVQRELRYFAFSLGEGGLTPRTLDSIWSTRFGDCKDAATLYAAGARRLGLDACPALVSTTHGLVLNDFIPSSEVFNHCIVRLRLEGVSYWLDPTVPMQSGALSNVFQPQAGWALPLNRQATDLERLGDIKPLELVHWEDEITFGPKRSSPAAFHRYVDFSSWAADAIRNRIANEGNGEYARAALKEVQAVWPGAVETVAMKINDDAVGNKLSLALAYEIRDCWKPGKESSRLEFLVPFGVNRELTPLPALPRECAIYLGDPRKMTSQLRLNMPCKWTDDGWLHRLEAPHVTFVDRFWADRRTAFSTRELTISGWTIPAADVEAYNGVAKKLQEDMLIIPARERFGRVRPWIGMKGHIINGLNGTLRLGAFAVFLVWLLAVVLKILFAPK